MASSSQPDSDALLFTMRIVNLDYYMAPPIPDLDFCYSSFQGRKVEEVPVIRIYGSTPAGQKTCLHIHRALPYLYVPIPEVLHTSPDEGHAFIHSLCDSIEKALRFKNSSASKRLHVHGCCLVRAKKLYGYHSSEELFAKIFLYYPRDIARAASRLLDGAVLDRTFQPYESHIPYLLQFLVDYNLFGMGLIHISNIKFRLPLPDVFSLPPTCLNNVEEGKSQDSCKNARVWLSSSVPSALVWTSPGARNDELVDRGVQLPRRQSMCQLEVDSSADDIINQNFKMYTSLSQTGSDMKLVQSLIPIWEEHERLGMLEVVEFADPSKPSPANVLTSFVQGFESAGVFSELTKGSEKFLLSKDTKEANEKIDQYIKAFIEIEKPCQVVETLRPNSCLDEKSICPEQNSNAEVTCGSLFESREDFEARGKIIPEFQNLHPITQNLSPRERTLCTDAKNINTEALGLLSWFASSQAAEDLNTGEELADEVMLSPLVCGKSYSEALEVAHLNYESESQKECQDIIDSVGEVLGSDRHKGRRLDDNTDNTSFSSGEVIPQVDGSSDDNSREPKISYIVRNAEGEKSPLRHEGKSVSLEHDRKRKHNSLWGSLPFDNEARDFTGIKSKPVNEMKDSCSFEFYNDLEVGSVKGDPAPLTVRESERNLITECSVRDLMRRKRFFHPQKSECDRQPVKEQSESNFPGEVELYCEQESDDKVGNGKQGVAAISPLSSAECFAVTFSRKPPSKDKLACLLEGSSGFSACCNQVSEPVEDFGGERVEDLPPFFMTDFEYEKSFKLYLGKDSIVDHEASVLGIPTYFQNDGSPLYLLTHASKPPLSYCVHQWLSELGKKDSNFKGTSPNLSKVEGCHSLLGQSISQLESAHEQDEAKSQCSTEDSSILNSHLKPCSENRSNSKDEKTPSSSFTCDKLEECNSQQHWESSNYGCYEMSQISGPDEKSHLTPLSQMGFRDPASVGGGQQLTLMSIEVQAETRGDLRPDPQFDAINIIALALQEDTEERIDIHVLICSENEDSYERNMDGIYYLKFEVVSDEKKLLEHFVKIISSSDPDILMGWEVQNASLGFLAERSAHLGINLLKSIPRTPAFESKNKASVSTISEEGVTGGVHYDKLISDASLEDAIITDEWGQLHSSGIHVGGRIVLNVWRLMRSEVKLTMYSLEAVAEEVLRRKVPSIPFRILNKWFSSGHGGARFRCIEYIIDRVKLNLQIINQLDMVNRTSELARVFGIDFYSVLSRGSQYRVESMLLRLAHTQNYLAISPGNQQVASQPAMECLPLVMEPESGFYADPVVVLDFQSLYPSMIIAYNLCFSTCLGNVLSSKSGVLGVSSYCPDPKFLMDMKEQLLITPNGVMYAPSNVRKGVLPHLLEEILSTRIMVKKALRKLMPSQKVLQRIFNARQLALKLIANVTYGYTAAGFSGRMPCAELADSIVQCGRRTLETAISFVNKNEQWNARVVYGDTDSMFVLLKGRTVKEAFRIGNEIASSVTSMNPSPVTLKLEKVYHRCFLITKKRYVGYSYETPDQCRPLFDAKGIETVRRDTCAAVAKIMEKSIRIIFMHQDILKVKSYLQRQWTRILSGKISLQDFVFAKEVRLGTYSARPSSLPPAAIVATKAMRLDPRAAPQYGQRVPYIVVHGEPGARLVDMVVDPLDLLEINTPYRLNDLYYINKQIIPALQRVLGLLGVDLNKWFSQMPRPVRPGLAKQYAFPSHTEVSHEQENRCTKPSKKAYTKSRIDTYYSSTNCILCGELINGSRGLCMNCSEKGSVVVASVTGKTSKLEREIQHLAAICRHCGGGDWIIESGVKCESLACPVFYERRKVQKQLQSISICASEMGLYPRCNVEWF